MAKAEKHVGAYMDVIKANVGKMMPQSKVRRNPLPPTNATQRAHTGGGWEGPRHETTLVILLPMCWPGRSVGV
jgi:hypothetical protein